MATNASVPSPGDSVWIPTAAYLAHGRDDFSGGRCTVTRVAPEVSAGRAVPFIEVAQRPGWRYNWTHLAGRQDALRRLHGDAPGRADPDYADASNPINGF